MYIYFIEGKQSYWLSGTDLVTEGKFVWMSNGKEFSYTNWIEGEPSGKAGTDREHCIHIWDAYFPKWNDRSCDDDARYLALCEAATQIRPYVTFVPANPSCNTNV